MPTSAPLVSGYDSDSDEGEDTVGPRALSSSTTASVATSAPKPFGLKLPPPSSSSNGPQTSAAKAAGGSKRKADSRLQIKIDALERTDEREKEGLPKTKRPAMDKAASSSSHGLFGLLPAPSQNPVKAESKESSLTTAGAVSEEDAIESEAAEEGEDQPKKKAKGNSDFRAMLGLAPTAAGAIGAAAKARRPSAAPPKLQRPSASITESELGNEIENMDNAARGQSETTNFFSFGRPEERTKRQQNTSTSSFTVSAAPILQQDVAQEVATDDNEEDEEDRYRGWQQDPDGSWVPITPEAHAAYAAWAASQGPSTGVDLTNLPAGVREDALQDVDAAALATEAWKNRPTDHSFSASAGSDARYAAAAASAAGEADPNVAPDEETKRRDRLTNHRAQKKGQLSSLLAQAEDNREKLEERWSRGKSARGEARAKYGF